MEGSGRWIIAMKGHPGTGKSTLARALAKTLNCPLIDKDDVKDCTSQIQNPSPAFSETLNDLCYSVLWKITKTQIDLGLNVVVDSPLSRKSHLDCLCKVADESQAKVVVVECRPENVDKWRRRVEKRGEGRSGEIWHKPATWLDMERLMERYGGCTDYDVGYVKKIIVDTTSEAGVDEMVAMVLSFICSSQ